MGRRFHDIAEFGSAVGERLGESGWREISQAQVDAFATVTGDHQWIHTDPVRAAQGLFGRPIAHGYLVLSLASHLLTEVFTVDGVAMVVNTGVRELRFLSVVPVGARVRLVVDLASVQPRARGSVEIALAATMEIEGQAVPAFTAELGSILRPARPVRARTEAVPPAQARPTAAAEPQPVTH